MTILCGVCARLSAADGPAILWQDANWIVKHAPAPFGVAGWMTLYARRHVEGISDFADAEADTIGPVLRNLHRALEAVTGAVRIYSAALGESAPHFHMHMIPRYADGVAGWSLFAVHEQISAGAYEVDPREVEEVSAAYRKLLAGR